jgi:hypothetical protein
MSNRPLIAAILASLLFAGEARAETARIWGKTVQVRTREQAAQLVERSVRYRFKKEGFTVGSLKVKVGKKVYPLGYPLERHEVKDRYALPFREHRVVAEVTDSQGRTQTMKLAGRVNSDPSHTVTPVDVYGWGLLEMKSSRPARWRKPDWTPKRFEKRYGYAQMQDKINRSRRARKPRTGGWPALLFQIHARRLDMMGLHQGANALRQGADALRQGGDALRQGARALR